MEQERMVRKTSLLVLMCLPYCSTVTSESRTYDHLDGVTGRPLTCNRCPPGFFLRSHCTSKRQTECSPCPADHFTQFWNYLPKCLYCNTFCDENQVVKEECSALQNRVCECKRGFYWDSEFCNKHAECPPGYGVKRHGTAHSNTECDKCPRGSFSPRASSQDTCRRHTDCDTLGQHLILKGTAKSDNLCFPCPDYDGDTDKLHFDSQKRRMARFVTLVLDTDHWDLDEKRRKLLRYSVSKWLNGADEKPMKRPLLKLYRFNHARLAKLQRNINHFFLMCTYFR